MSVTQQPSIVAILQNTWARDPATVQAMLDRDPATRAVKVALLLFGFGCRSGQRLRTAFGDLCDSIVWENACPIVSGPRAPTPAPDCNHVARVLDRYDPALILAFGRVACWAVEGAPARTGFVTRFYGPHPAARHASVIADLNAMAVQLRRWKAAWDRGREIAERH